MASEPDAGQHCPVRGPQVAQWLLANNYLLTAFELLVESQESGKEADAGSLREFFSDLNKFPPEEIAQFDQDDAINLQKLAKLREEKLSVAEYELRIAREDLAEFQKAQHSGTALHGDVSWTPEGCAKEAGSAAQEARACAEGTSLPESLQGAPKTWERQQLNAVVKEFLGQAGYRLTAITFQEEAGDPAPLSLGPSPALLHMLRAHAALGPALSARQELEEKCSVLQKEMEEATTAAATAQEALAAAVKEGNRLRADLEYAHSKLDLSRRQLQELQAAAKASAEVGKTNRGPKKKDTEDAGFGVVNIENALREVSRTLPKIVPNVLINKREELVPLFLALIQEDRDAEQRERLTHALFNIVKKPTALQRRMITTAFHDLAARIGVARTSEELLPQCWEQVGHRHAERRMLVAETVGELAPLVAPEMRGSLLLSILQQLAGDEEAGVRHATTCTLARLLRHLPDTDKFPLVKELLLGLLEDTSHDVVEAVFDKLVPASLGWTAISSPALLRDLLARITTTLSQCPRLGSGSSLNGDEMRLIGDAQLRQVQVVLRLFSLLLPEFHTCLIRQAPVWARVEGAATACGPSQASPQNDGQNGSRVSTPPKHAPLANGSSATGDRGSEGASSTFTAGSTTLANGCCGSDGVAPAAGQGSSSGAHAHEDGSGATNGGGNAMGDVVPAVREGAGTVGSDGSTSPGTGDRTHVNGGSGDGGNAVVGEEGPAGVARHGNGASCGTEGNPTGESVPQGPGWSGRDVELTTKSEGSGEEGHQHTTSSQTQDSGDVGMEEGDVAMARWLEVEEHAQWELLEWCLADCIPALLQAGRMIPPAREVETLRRRLCLALKAVCEVIGPDLSLRYVEPLLCVATTIPPRRPTLDLGLPYQEPAPHVTKLLADQTPQSSEAGRAGRLCLLPLLLAGVLPAAGSEALSDMLHHLSSTSSPRNMPWALQHPEDMVAALRFAAAFEEAQGPLQSLIASFSKEELPSSRECAAMCSGAIAPCLPSSQVMRQVVAALDLLCRDREPSVQSIAIDALAEVYAVQSSNPAACKRLQTLFDSISSAGHEEEVKVIWAVAQRAGVLLDGQLEYLLQKALMLLTIIRQPSTGGRSPLQLKGAATVVLRAVHSIYQHQDMQVMGETVRLHLVAALQALQREASLLDSHDLETLNAMLEGVRNSSVGSSFQPRGSGALMLEPRHSAALSDMTLGPMASGDLGSMGGAGLKASIFLHEQGRSLQSLRLVES